jgi:hypothetical protein
MQQRVPAEVGTGDRLAEVVALTDESMLAEIVNTLVFCVVFLRVTRSKTVSKST